MNIHRAAAAPPHRSPGGFVTRASTLARSISAVCLATTLLGGSGCAVKRDVGPGRPLGEYDYAVLSRQSSQQYYDTAAQMLSQSFVVVDENDPRLELRSVRRKACLATVDYARGFWSTSAWVELKDYAHGTHVHTSHMRRGMLWVGAHEDVLEAIRDVAAARAAGPAIPPEARAPMR